jgi:hypothetical protein
MSTKKKIGIGLGCVVFFLSFLTSSLTFFTPPAYADTIASPDGQPHLLVFASDKKTNYQVTITNSRETISLPYDASWKGYYSKGLGSSGVTGGDCIDSTTRGIQSFTISIKSGGKLVGDDPFNFCGKGQPFVQTTTVSISAPQDPASFGGCVTYKDDQGKTQTFKSEASGKLSGPNGKTYNLKFDDKGCITTIRDLPPGDYKVTVDYLPPNLPDQHLEKGFTLKAGDNFKLTGAEAGAAGTAPTDEAGDDSAGAKEACKKYAPGGADENSSVYTACLGGYADGTDGKSQKEACDDKFPADSKRLEGCLLGFNAASATEGDDTSACVANSSTSMEWLFCPLITAMGHGIEKLNDLVESQMKFNVNKFLPDDGGVYKAWSIIRNLSTTIVVILLLIMVISQAIGNGVFEAYTVRKILPRAVIAVIAMQLSWELSIFAINFVNDIGEGLAQLLAAPFGGKDSLDLPSLLNHLGAGWAGTASISLTAGFVAAGFLGLVFLPGALLLVFSVLLTVLIAVASVLFKNIVIIGCVIFASVALLMWVIPNQSTKKYWGQWSDNFSKALLLFPIMMGIIYGGRIFAWIAGDVGNAGPLDFILVLIGFFGSYAVLARSWKWGGSWVQSGHNLASTNGAVKKVREVGNKELKEWQKRRQNLYGKANLNPGADGYAKARKIGSGPLKGMPYGWNGRLGNTMLTNVKSGRYMPTKRSLGTAIQRQDKENSEEKAIEGVITERERQKAYGTSRDVMSGKQISIDNLIEGLKAASGAKGMAKANANRSAEAALRDLIKSNSFYELDKIKIEDPDDIDPNTGKGREKFIWETDLWFRTIVNDNELYGQVSSKRPDWQPHRLPSGGPGYRGQWGTKEQNEYRERKQKQLDGNVRSENPNYTDAEVGTEVDKRLAVEMNNEGRRRERLRASAKLPEHENLQYAEALTTVMDETSPQQLANQSPLVFDRVARMAKSGVERGKKAKNLLGEAEAARSRGDVAGAEQLTKKAQEQQIQANMLLAPADSLRSSFNRMAAGGGAQLLQSIAGGKETGELVDKVLKISAEARNVDAKIQLPELDGQSLLKVKASAPAGGLHDNMQAIIDSRGNNDTVDTEAQAQATPAGAQPAPAAPAQAAAQAPPVAQGAASGAAGAATAGATGAATTAGAAAGSAATPGAAGAAGGGGGLGKTEFKQAMKEALEESGATLRVPHGPETIGTGERFEESQLFKPQERRARPPEEPPTTPPAS